MLVEVKCPGCGKEHDLVSSEGYGYLCGCGKYFLINDEKKKPEKPPQVKKFYRTWRNMITRSSMSNLPKFEYYRKRGICAEWKNFEKFKSDMYEAFLQHVLKYGISDTTIDRIDNSKGYTRENCRWATWQVQRDNRTYVDRNEILCKKCGKVMYLTPCLSGRKFCNNKCRYESRITVDNSVDKVGVNEG